ncbi:hypothetical protein BS47DRAFT_1369735 [Hydnum rufescens UP504]|uniref:Uncharacterized protein n=1 Tax=Hydnum rufescens UP504 TaxID=1448309 RepID=A0A9P6ACF9_9AGAM|nr:hypothetical protein BS47DRAFT_1369735 [Hydnum rufescens UP504]
MWTAVKKQFYTLALIDALMKELPSHWLLQFGTSIFHTYGHQWVCQLWYHPQKGDIWELSDGEGCEQLWAYLRKLIPGLQVTGYHRRLFILDLQIEQCNREEAISLRK